jgi:hypothetical protein
MDICSMEKQNGHSAETCSMDMINICSAHGNLLIYLVYKSAHFLLDCLFSK